MEKSEQHPKASQKKDAAKRALRAILIADVQGYSRMMSQNELLTIRTLKDCRVLMKTRVLAHHGRVVDTPGDNILTEFQSVVDAVEAAVEIQRELKKRNDRLPDSQKMLFRMGINLGDIIMEEDRIYGDGINIAARLEGLAEGGGICISGTVHDHVKSKIDLEYEFLGEQTVKNIDEPVRVYRIRLEPPDSESPIKSKRRFASAFRKTSVILGICVLVAAAGWIVWKFKPVRTMEHAIIDRKADTVTQHQASIAVLPFANMSGDISQDFFVDGITENIITVLSKISGLLVISRESSFSYKDQAEDVQEIGRKLGVLYLLKGSMQKSADNVRISVQLLDTDNGELLWADRYDRTMKDIFALQDEITLKIIEALNIHLTHGEQSLILSKGTQSLDAYLKILQGMELLRSGSADETEKIKILAQEAITLDPNYSKGYLLLAMSEVKAVREAKSTLDDKMPETAYLAAQKAITLDPVDPTAHLILGTIHLHNKEYAPAIVELEKVVALNPNSIEGLLALGRIRMFEQKPEEAIELFQEAKRRDPLGLDISYGLLGRAYILTKQYDKATSILKKITMDRPDNLLVKTDLIFCYTQLGMTAEADAFVKEILGLDPQFSAQSLANKLPYGNPEFKLNYLNALRKAGLP